MKEATGAARYAFETLKLRRITSVATARTNVRRM